MIFGMSTATYTFLHVLISLVGIGSGLIVMFGFLTGKRLDGWTALFLITTVATSVTGFGFPFRPSSAFAYPRHHLAGDIGSCDFRAISASPRWSLAPDLCDLRADCALPQCFRSGGAVFREAAGCLKPWPRPRKNRRFIIAQLVGDDDFIGLTMFAAKKFREESANPLAGAA